jgi:predicted GIY-YIG superfamily endonuclease
VFYFYYFKDTKTNLYYGGITNNVLKRQKQHQRDLKNNKKSFYKPWHLYQDKIQLIVLWSFETKFEACVYEKQWIINNYLNHLCLNCSISISEFNCSTEKHRQLSEEGGSYKAKIRYALEVNSPEIVHTFSSAVKASKFTGVYDGDVSHSCKNAKPYNGAGRWLFSDVSKADLQTKFKNLTQAEIKGANNRKFVLIDIITKQITPIFNSIYEPQRQGYRANPCGISRCIRGKNKKVENYTVKLL